MKLLYTVSNTDLGRILLNLLKKALMENLIFRAVVNVKKSAVTMEIVHIY